MHIYVTSGSWSLYLRNTLEKLNKNTHEISYKDTLSVINSSKGCSIALIHDTRYLCTPLRIDGLKTMSRGISGGKQVTKVANTSNRIRVYLLSQPLRENDLIVVQNVQFESRQVVRHYYFLKDIYARYCIQKRRKWRFQPIVVLLLSSFR